MFDTATVPNRYHKLWDAMTREGAAHEDRTTAIKALQQKDHPDRGEPMGIVICPMTWQPLLCWRA